MGELNSLNRKYTKQIRELEEKNKLQAETILELRDDARLRGFGGYSKLTRQQLVDILYPLEKG
jgi:hypothetical protein